MVETRDDQRSIDETEQCCEKDLNGTGDSCVNNCRDRGTDLPADGAQNEVCRHYGKSQGEERNKDHGHYGRNDLSKELLKINQAESREHSRDDLCLITDHIDLCEAEIPLRDVRCRCACHCIGVQELSGDQCHTKDQTEHFGCAHLLGDGPADTYRNTYVEDRLTDQPQEVVDACPELAELYQCMSALENVQGVNTVAEAQDQTAGDDRGQKGRKDLRQNGCQSLQRILIFLGRLLDRILGNAADPGDFRKIVVELGNRVSDDDLELTGLREGDCVKVPFTAFMLSILPISALPGSLSTKRMRVMQCATAPTFSLPPTYWSNSLASSVYLPILSSSFLISILP